MMTIDERKALERVGYSAPEVEVIGVRLASFLQTSSHPTDGICGDFENLDNDGEWESDNF